jgi:hypothetical protein
MTYPVSPPDPPEAAHWVTLPAEFLCAMVRLGDKKFRDADAGPKR